MLTKRDTFVRYLDPLKIVWEDAEGNVHFSLVDALKAFNLSDTPAHREALTAILTDLIKKNAGEDAKILHRPGPDSADYFFQQTDPDKRN